MLIEIVIQLAVIHMNVPDVEHLRVNIQPSSIALSVVLVVQPFDSALIYYINAMGRFKTEAVTSIQTGLFTAVCGCIV